MAMLGIGRKWAMVVLAAIVIILILVLSVGHENVTSVLDSSFAGNFVLFDSTEEEVDCEVAAETEIKLENYQRHRPVTRRNCRVLSVD